MDEDDGLGLFDWIACASFNDVLALISYFICFIFFYNYYFISTFSDYKAEHLLCNYAIILSLSPTIFCIYS